ncbi:helix-turn-helix transcriptional regulator [Streptomyces sp. ISL-96]|uniref:helix-turn-helix domain-containing protein n=1 Tax=Streptomyces sp. ISL-96 TaxID=2819191 RepID=UPI001BE7D7B3|nr:helix-turn-helix transcriptional regulator [Streptomyces sp. ISL-96]MBT2492080.1 helix-turn-helix transcriptional regulator [Streptomyces sp. ISL-96]
MLPGARHCARCRCRLSRYNQDDYCSGCTRSLPGALPDWPRISPHVWQSTEVQEALFDRDFGAVCLLVRQSTGLRQDDVAALTGLSQGYLSMIESGTRTLTNIDKIVRLLDGLQAPDELTGPMLRPRSDGEDGPRLRTPAPATSPSPQ